MSTAKEDAAEWLTLFDIVPRIISAAEWRRPSRTPGSHDAAYFEHPFLADQMGAELVERGALRVQITR